MLINALPKSASTSLQHTLIELLNTKKGALTGQTKVAEDEDNWDAMQHAQKEWKSKQIKKAAEDKKIYKHHIPPTSNNIEAVRQSKSPMILLLRNHRHSADAFFRHTDEKNSDPVNQIKDEKHYKKLKAQLADWYFEWLKAASSNNSICVVYFEYLTDNPSTEIKRILKHHDYCPCLADDANLKQMRYTGHTK